MKAVAVLGVLASLIVAGCSALPTAGPTASDVKNQEVKDNQLRFDLVDIDDNVMDQVGKWPWDRTTQAEIIDEIAAAGPKVLVPDLLYSDHGCDFTSRHMDQVCADLHIQLVHSTAGQPQGRGKIERFFSTVNQLLLSTLPGHLVHGRPATPPKVTLAQLDEALQAFIVGDYHFRPHGETRQPPQER